MRILIIKTSSMGDVIHTLPAVTDLAKVYPHAKIDWVVEESFVPLAQAHSAVNKVIPIALRRWRKTKKIILWREIKEFLINLREHEYDYVVDPQGLLKSVLLTYVVRYNKATNAQSHGYDIFSIRGKYISWLYSNKYTVVKKQHAIYRIKSLFSKVFRYGYDDLIDYGVEEFKLTSGSKATERYIVFLHCTTWDSKKWPVKYWQDLIGIVKENGYAVKLNSGNQFELEQAYKIAEGCGDKVEVMQPQSITSLLQVIAQSDAVVSVDTGLGHLAAALNKPGVGIFGATDARLTGILSNNFKNLQSNYLCSPCLLKKCNKLDNFNPMYAPCYNELKPEFVWDNLKQLLQII